MDFQLVGEWDYVAKFSNGVIIEVPVSEGFRVMYDAVRRELRTEVGGSLFYECAFCNVSVAYVVAIRKGIHCQTQYCFEKEIGIAFASCVDKVTHFEFDRREC